MQKDKFFVIEIFTRCAPCHGFNCARLDEVPKIEGLARTCTKARPLCIRFNLLQENDDALYNTAY